MGRLSDYINSSRSAKDNQLVNVEVDPVLVRMQQQALAVLFVSNKDTRKRIRKIIREELKDAVKRVREDARFSMENDPRQAYRAVKSMVYRKILGGNISILNKKKAGSPRPLVKHRKVEANPTMRGGNRRPVSERTRKIEEYFGADRAFILRFLNSGTKVRYSGYGRNGRTIEQYHRYVESTGGMGHRGAIAPNNWFANYAPHEMDLAADNLSAVIEEELAAAYEKEIKN